MAELRQYLNTMNGMLESVGYHRPRAVFTDFVEVYAVALANVFLASEELDERYRRIMAKYKESDRVLFPRLHAQLVCALTDYPSDVLGQLYMEMDASSSKLGQFFTPQSITDLLARLSVPNVQQLHRTLAEVGFINSHEPAAGGGALVIAQAFHLLDLGINYQQYYHALAIDIDLTAVHMAYLQLSLLHIPATVVHGNALTLEEHSRWYTPAFYMGAFGPKLRRGYALGSLKDQEVRDLACHREQVEEDGLLITNNGRRDDFPGLSAQPGA